MKKLFIISLLFCSCICKGQKDTLFLEEGILLAPNLATITGAEIQDTVPKLLLLCDTSNHAQLPITYWIKGLAARVLVYGNKPCPTNSLRYLMNCMGWNPVSETYLDENKQPLSRDIIVWMSKDIQ